MKLIQCVLLAISLFLLGFTNVYGETTLSDDMATLKELLTITDRPEYISDKNGFKVLVIPSSIEGLEYVAYKHVDVDAYGFGVRACGEILLIHWNIHNWYVLGPDYTGYISPEIAQIEWSTWVEMVNKNGDLKNIHPMELTGAILI